MKAQFEINGNKITIEASKDTLSRIQAMADYTSRYFKLKGYQEAAMVYDQWFNDIYDALDAKGYYDKFND